MFKEVIFLAVPDYQTVMLSLLKLVSDKQEHKMSDVIETKEWEGGNGR